MTLNQRISPSLSETLGGQQARLCSSRGFTLIELMVVVGIMGIISMIAIGPWVSVRADKQVQSAAEKVRSAMAAARMKALSTGKTQYVGVDLTNDAIASTAYDENLTHGYNVVANTWGAIAWEPVDNVDLQESSSVGVVATGAPAIKTFSFKTTGATTATGTTWSILAQSKDPSVPLKEVLTVNSITGRAQLKEF